MAGDILNIVEPFYEAEGTMSIDVSSTTTINGCRTTRIYCRPDCPAGRRTKPENRVHFQSREDAIAQGYRACKICKPDGPHPEIETLLVQHYVSPLGTYLIIASQRGIICVEPEDQIRARLARLEKAGIQLESGRNQHTETMARELDAYFRGRLQQFNVPMDLRGTPFQRQVWEALCRIPYGKTLTYGELACSIGRPEAARAVGHAIGSNPVSIAVPCHRVLGANGSLTGYGGGLHRKDALLRLEGSLLHSNERDHQGR
ncbi:MAG: methylated-DNA--[protein]-cysteine S-methyltransferase [Chloroflexota bacterium]